MSLPPPLDIFCCPSGFIPPSGSIDSAQCSKPGKRRVSSEEIKRQWQKPGVHALAPGQRRRMHCYVSDTTIILLLAAGMPALPVLGILYLH